MPASAETKTSPRRRWKATALSQYAMAVTVVLLVSLANCSLKPIVGVHATALIYLLAVVVLALFVGRGPVFLAATLSALIWDYYFLPPVFEFRVTTFEDGALVVTYFVVALVLGELMSRTREQEEARRQGEVRATALYVLTRELAALTDLDVTLPKVVRQMREIFDAEITLVLEGSPKRLAADAHPSSSFEMNAAERKAAVRVFEYGQWAGQFTGNPMAAQALYAPLVTGEAIVGVVGLKFNQSASPTTIQRELLIAFAQQIALALDRIRLRETSERARLLAESERLSKTLLNSISHEIRTPIAAIKSATGNLAELSEPPLSEPQHAMLAEIHEANDRLDRLVGKVLEIARLESGSVKPKATLCDVTDLIHMAVKETRKELAQHKLTVDIAPGLPLVPMDFVLTQQTLTNLLSNAAFHTPAGTAIQLTARADGGKLTFVVADEGPGIPAESLPRVFEKFYRGTNAAAGGTGLGLSLVKGFIEAQGGTVHVQNRATKGAAFTLCLPLAKLPETENQPT